MKKITITENGIERVQFYTDKEFKVLVNGVELGAKEESKKEKYIPKVGDCVRIESNGIVSVCKITATNDRFVDSSIFVCITENDVIFDENKPGRVLGWKIKECIFTQITPEELQAEFKKCGYEYDFESGKAMKLRWKPKMGEIYFSISGGGRTSREIWQDDKADNAFYNLNNCHKTEQDAQKFRDYMKNYKNE